MNRRLIACANIFGGVNSVYRWKGQLADETEWVMIGKTAEEKFDEVRRVVEDLHPYEIPCIIKIPVCVNNSFGAWLKDEIAEGECRAPTTGSDGC